MFVTHHFGLQFSFYLVLKKAVIFFRLYFMSIYKLNLTVSLWLTGNNYLCLIFLCLSGYKSNKRKNGLNRTGILISYIYKSIDSALILNEK